MHKKDDEMKNDNITVETVGVLEHGNDFINCKIISASTQKAILFRSGINTKVNIFSENT